MLIITQTALELGFLYALVAMALFLSYRILDIADLTTDGCFVLGAAVSVTATAAGHPVLAIVAAMLAGKDITFVPEHERSRCIGRLFQDPLRGTAPSMTIEENLALAYLRAAHGNPFSRISKKDKEFFAEQLKQLDMGLEDRMKNPVGLLSGGQRQALTLLMATMVPPQLLLLDEHTAALDPATAEKVLDLTRRVVAESHITCLMVTHNMHQALELGNHTLMMADGHIVLDVAGSERAGMGVDDLIARFKAGAGHELDNDRILLSE